MSSTRELLGRLNPTTVRFDVGRGGAAPALTAQEIAGALALVPAGLGREVMIACWWPDGARLKPQALMQCVLREVATKWARQGRALHEARLDLNLAEVAVGWSGRSVTREQQNELARARARLSRVKSEMWPVELPALLPALVRTAISEISGRRECPRCQGRGDTTEGELRAACETCAGTGVVAMSDRARAESIGRHVESYRRNWAPVYGVLLRRMMEAEQEAVAAFRNALREPDRMAG